MRHLLLIISTLSCLSLTACFRDPLSLDERQILKDTRMVHKNVRYGNEPFLKKEAFQDLTAFLLRHLDSIKHYNRHAEQRSIKLAEGSWWSQYTNTGDCFEIATFHPEFIKEYIPPELVDSLLYYVGDLKNNPISRLVLCSKGCIDNIDSTKGSVSYMLNYKQKGAGASNCYVHHSIIQNVKFEKNLTLHTIYDAGLTKDTTLVNDLRYTIIVNPYSGF